MAHPVDLTKLISLVLWSAYVKPSAGGDKTVSALLVSKIESGKTKLVEQFIHNDGILYATNVTEYGLLNKHREEMIRGVYKHIVIPDFIKTLNQKRDTVNTLITFLNAYIEEGVQHMASYAIDIRLDKPMRGGLLSTIALDDFQKMRKTLAACGFLSRLLVLSYSYSQAHIQQIFQDIAMDRGVWKETRLQFPKEPIEVYLSPDLALQLTAPSQRIADRLKGTGFRAQHIFQSLAKASALSDCRTSVTADDIVNVLQLATDYVGLEFRPIGINGCIDQNVQKDANGKQTRMDLALTSNIKKAS